MFRRTWVKGERKTVGSVDSKGRHVPRLGKNGGPVIAQLVELHLIPKEHSA